MPEQKLGVVILGAGASARMGRPKLLLPWRGTTVIGQIISQWRELGAAQIAVVLRAGDVALAAELARLDFAKSDCIVNPQPARGMFSSVGCAAAWRGWQKEISHWAMVLGDQPHLKSETLGALMNFSAHHPEAICQPESAGRERHPVILPGGVFAALKNSGADSLKVFLEHNGCPRRRCRVDDAGLALDLDTPEDWQRAGQLPIPPQAKWR